MTNFFEIAAALGVAAIALLVCILCATALYVLIGDFLAERAMRKAADGWQEKYPPIGNETRPGPSPEGRKPTPYRGDVIASLKPEDFPPLPTCGAGVAGCYCLRPKVDDTQPTIPAYGTNEAIKAAVDMTAVSDALVRVDIEGRAGMTATSEAQVRAELEGRAMAFATGRDPKFEFSHFSYGRSRKGRLTVSAVGITRLVQGIPDSSMTGDSELDGPSTEPRMSEFAKPGGYVQRLDSGTLAKLAPGGTHFQGATRVHLAKGGQSDE